MRGFFAIFFVVLDVRAFALAIDAAPKVVCAPHSITVTLCDSCAAVCDSCKAVFAS